MSGRHARVLRRYARRWDERCAREVARWAWLSDRVERDAEGERSTFVGDGLLALNAITLQSTGASKPSRRTRLDWRALRTFLREIAAGIDPLALRERNGWQPDFEWERGDGEK